MRETQEITVQTKTMRIVYFKIDPTEYIW